MSCVVCGAASDGPRLPNGWKRKGEAVYCKACWRERYVLRAITMPIAEPLDGLDWKSLRDALREQWALVASASNWMISELYARDIRRNGQAKMPPMPRVYLYPETRKKFPGLEPTTASSLEQSVSRKYRAARYKLLWTGEASLPVHRYPQPLPLHNQRWHVDIVDERPVLSVRIGDAWVRLRLKGGPRFRRQLGSVRQLVAGNALPGEAAIYKAHDGALMAKMVAWLPRPPQRETAGGLWVNTSPEALLFAVSAEDSDVNLWVYRGDHVRRWSAEHRTKLERWSDDAKLEARKDRPMQPRIEAAAVKYRHRMSSACHEAAAYVAGYAERRKFASVTLRDTTHEFCPGFPWHDLTRLLKEKIEARGMEFLLVASDEAANETASSLARE